MDTLSVFKMTPEAILPTRVHKDDAGMDIYCLEDITLEPGQGKAIRSGIAMAINVGHVGMVADRSSMAKRGIKCAGGVIDSGYRGEVHVVLWNISSEIQKISKGERMAQMLIIPIKTPAVQEANELDQTSRGTKGFGSSGR